MKLSRREFLAGAAALASGPAMASRRQVPFRAGRSDLDSGIACARMAMTFFEPKEHFPVADLAEMTDYTDGHWFFEPQLVPIMIKKGRRAELFSDVNYQALAEGRGIEKFGPDAAAMIDLGALKWALRTGASSAQRPGLDLPAVLSKWNGGGFLMLSVDRGILRGENLPYCRYFVVVTGFDGNSVSLHDPSLGPNRELPLNRMIESFNRPPGGRAALLLR